MTALDWVLLLIIAISALLGAWRGMIGVVASIAAWVCAGLAAFQLGADVGAMLGQGAPGWGERVSGYLLAFGVVWLLVTLAGWMLRKLADSAGLTPFDRALGLGLGTARGVFLACALLLALALGTVPREPVWRDSTGVALLLPMADWMRGGVPDWMAQRMDLDGRGVSLQEQLQGQAQALQAALPPGVALSGVDLADVDLADLAAVPPDPGVAASDAPGRGTAGGGAPAAVRDTTPSSQGSAGTTPDAALVH
jgi:membrane protein required for colicin V production